LGEELVAGEESRDSDFGCCLVEPKLLEDGLAERCWVVDGFGDGDFEGGELAGVAGAGDVHHLEGEGPLEASDGGQQGELGLGGVDGAWEDGEVGAGAQVEARGEGLHEVEDADLRDGLELAVEGDFD
jgi:hypothetical protein